MKNIIKIITLLIATISCKAQSPIFDIEDVNHITGDVYGAYYKDVNNQLNAYEGTYLYTNGTTTLKIMLRKVIQSSMNDYYYEDLIIGEYEYIENGILIKSTLSDFLTNYANQIKHSIKGHSIIDNTSPGCNECDAGEKAVSLGLVENSTDNYGTLIVRRVLVGNQPAIKIIVMWGYRSRTEGDPPKPHASFPAGYYTLIKQ